MPTATIDEAVADVATDTAKTKPITSDFYHGVSLGVFPKTIKRDDGTEYTRYSSKIEVRYKKDDGEYASTSYFDEEQLATLEDFARDARRAIREAKAKQRTEAKQ